MFGNKKKIEELKTELVKIDLEFGTAFEGLSKRLDAIDEVMEEFKEYQEHKKIMKDSDEPWADFMTELESDGRVKVKLDWNKAMITELRRMGFNAQSEEDMVSAYFSRLVGEHGEAMSHQDLEDIKNA